MVNMVCVLHHVKAVTLALPLGIQILFGNSSDNTSLNPTGGILFLYELLLRVWIIVHASLNLEEVFTRKLYINIYFFNFNSSNLVNIPLLGKMFFSFD